MFTESGYNPEEQTLLDEVGKSQPRDEPQYLPRANQVCLPPKPAVTSSQPNYLAFIQCPLHLCRFTAPECSLRTQSGLIPQPLNN